MAGQVPRVLTNEAYVRAAESSGLLPLVLPPLLDPSSVDALLDVVDGVILTGGEDVEPARYGALPHALLETPNPARDALELELVARARERRIPTLAICRGLQVVNVALGGTLVQDLASERPGNVRHGESSRRSERVHAVRLEEGSRVARAIGEPGLRVNSSHHQAIARLASGLRATGHAEDGVIEAVETTDEWELFAVQWHPEELYAAEEPWDRALFAAFCETLRTR